MPLITPTIVDFGQDANKDLETFVFNNITTLKSAYQSLHEEKIPNWRRLTKGKPKDEQRNFPWPGASNTVIQLIGENVDTMKAMMIGSIYEILPIWPVGLLGDWKEEEKAEEQRRVYESFMDDMALSRQELDLYRVESLAANDIAEFGMVVVKFPWTTCLEQVVIGIDSESRLQEEEKTIYDGPRPEKLDVQDWAATPTASTFKDARFKYHKYTLQGKDQLEKRLQDGRFADTDEVRKVLESPDREGLDTLKETQLQDQNLQGWNPNSTVAEWDFYECWFWKYHNKKTYKIVYTYHFKTRTCMQKIFNFYIDNEEPFEFGRLGYTDDGLIGYGLAEMGEMYQEQVATQHNQRNDHGTLQNTSIILTGRSSFGMRLDSGFSIVPMACLPFNPDEFEIKQLGGNSSFSNIDDEQLTIALAKSRFGTDMGLPGGSGSGSVRGGGKGGPQYSSQGTFALMQTGTRRVNINVTDFRYLHYGIGAKCGKMYAEMGIGEDRLRVYGQKRELLQKALENVRNRKLDFPIKAATASINREVEKQTGMLFVQTMQRHFANIAQAVQAVSSPLMQGMPEFKQFLLGSINAQAIVMGRLIRAFGYDDIDRMQPEKEFVDKEREKEKQQQLQAMQQQQQRSQSNARPNGNAAQGNTGADQPGYGEPGMGAVSPQQNLSAANFGVKPV